MPLPPEHLLDELATAYVQAIAAQAGAVLGASRRDIGVDGLLKEIITLPGYGYVESGHSVDFSSRVRRLRRLLVTN